MALRALQGKVALITGAGSGIGRAASLALGKEGAKLVLAGRSEGPLQETAAALPASAAPLVVPTDCSDPAAVASLFATIEKERGRLDVLFNNAGSGAPAVPIDELPVEDWQRVVGINLNAVFLCSREAFGLMKRQQPQGGRIINNGSVSADRPRPNSAPYTATKHAVSGLTKSCALDGRPWRIACGQIDIGNADTKLAAPFKTPPGVPQAHGGLSTEPTMEVDDVGRAIVYMASLPLEANVLFMTVMATNMPLVGRG